MPPRAEKKKPVTMSEIARLAGVSQSTVSRILNGSASVAPEKHAAVMEVMEGLNFRPNVIAQGLVMGQTLAIGVLTRYLGSPFFGTVLRGIEQGVKENGYYPIVVSGGDSVKDDYQSIELLISRRVDGLIIYPHEELSVEYLHEIAAHTPLIIIGMTVPGLEDHCITVRNYDAAYQATTYLIKKGHTLIAHATGPQSRTDAILRREGYRQAMRDADLPLYPELIIEGEFAEAAAFMGVENLIKQRHRLPFTAIFCGNDQMAQGIRLALYRQNLSVPDDISLVGFDDIFQAQYMIPPLTTMRQPIYQLGFAATQSLFTLIAGRQSYAISFPAELVERETVRVISKTTA